MTIERDILTLYLETKQRALRAAEHEEKADDEKNKLIFRGKKEAYQFDANRIKALMSWHGIEEP